MTGGNSLFPVHGDHPIVTAMQLARDETSLKPSLLRQAKHAP